MSKQKRDLPEINFIAASLRTTTGEAHHDLAIANKNNSEKKASKLQETELSTYFPFLVQCSRKSET